MPHPVWATQHLKKYNVLRPSQLRWSLRRFTEKTPRKFQFGKKSAKVYNCLYSSTEQLQVALWTYMLLNLGLNNDKFINTLPLRSVPFHISPSLSLPLQTLRLVSLISFIAKTKRIAERSDTNCDTHTDRQSTLGKYMINWKGLHFLSCRLILKVIVSGDGYFLRVLKIKLVLFVWVLMGFTLFSSLFVEKIKNKFSVCFFEITYIFLKFFQ